MKLATEEVLRLISIEIGRAETAHDAGDGETVKSALRNARSLAQEQRAMLLNKILRPALKAVFGRVTIADGTQGMRRGE